MKKGASLAVWVRLEGADLEANKGHARLVPALLGGVGDSRVDLQLRDSALEAPVAANGFLQFTGVRPGSYRLEVTYPGYSPGRIFPVELSAGEEVAFREGLTLVRPLDAEVEIVPAFDWLGQPWRVSLFAAADQFERHEPRFQGTTDTDGRVFATALPRGGYLIQVEDSLGNPFASESDRQMVDEASSLQRVEVELIWVAGRVLLGKQGVAGAQLWFGGRFGATRVEARTDEEGTFDLVLPRAGDWSVEIAQTSTGLSNRQRARVTPDRHGRARLDLAVPQTELRGRVVDEQGGAVAGARVRLSSRDGSAEARSTSDGSFSLRHATAGPIVVEAEQRADGEVSTSTPLHWDLQEDIASPPVELVLERAVTVGGRVTLAGVPAVGATVALYNGLEPASFGGATTDLEGRFSLRTRRRTPASSAVVHAIGHGFDVIPLATNATTVEIALESQVGELVVELPEKPDVPFGYEPFLVFTKEGLPVAAQQLLRWAAAQEGRVRANLREPTLRIPRLAVGAWQACWVSPSGAPGSEPLGSALGPAVCAGGQLAAGGTLRLAPRLPAPTAAR